MLPATDTLLFRLIHQPVLSRGSSRRAHRDLKIAALTWSKNVEQKQAERKLTVEQTSGEAIASHLLDGERDAETRQAQDTPSGASQLQTAHLVVLGPPNGFGVDGAPLLRRLDDAAAGATDAIDKVESLVGHVDGLRGLRRRVWSGDGLAAAART